MTKLIFLGHRYKEIIDLINIKADKYFLNIDLVNIIKLIKRSFIKSPSNFCVIYDQRDFKVPSSFFEELINTLYNNKIPSILYSDKYSPEVIRYGPLIPCFLYEDQLKVERNIEICIESCLMEFDGKVPSDRSSHRTLAKIVDIRDNLVWIRLSGVYFKRLIKIPINFLLEKLESSSIVKDQYFIVRANVGANRLEDLYLIDFENMEED